MRYADTATQIILQHLRIQCLIFACRLVPIIAIVQPFQHLQHWPSLYKPLEVAIQQDLKFFILFIIMYYTINELCGTGKTQKCLLTCFGVNGHSFQLSFRNPFRTAPCYLLWFEFAPEQVLLCSWFNVWKNTLAWPQFYFIWVISKLALKFLNCSYKIFYLTAPGCMWIEHLLQPSMFCCFYACFEICCQWHWKIINPEGMCLTLDVFWFKLFSFIDTGWIQ